MNDDTYKFVQELKALLRKWDVEMTVNDNRYGTDVSFWAYTKWGADGEIVRDSIEYTTSWLDGGN